MKHNWQEIGPSLVKTSRSRQCRRCGVTQTHGDYGRRLMGMRVCGWFPPAGRCGQVNLRLRRIKAGRYKTADGLFEVWQEAEENFGAGCPRRWFVNHKDYDETLVFSGFRTKKQAVCWLRENAVEYAMKARGRHNPA